MRPSTKTIQKSLTHHARKPIVPGPTPVTSASSELSLASPPLEPARHSLSNNSIYSPTMSATDGPISLSRRSSVAFPSDPSSASEHPDKRRASATSKNSSLPTFSDFNKTANSPLFTSSSSHASQQVPSLSSSSSSSSSSNNSRPLHTLYPNSTPPMSPGVILSPVSRHHYGITDPSHYSSGGFYQLPPPLQPGESREGHHHRSPGMHPQTTSVHPLNPIQLPPLSPLTIGSSPRSAPQQHSLHMGSHHHSNHYPHSATGSTISPYPTPQHHPQHFSSPHQSPRYDRILPKQSIPAMNLPASALASSTTAFQVAPSRPSLSSYPPPTHSPAGDGKKGTVASSAFGSGSATSQFPSPHIHATDSRSAPGSPQRYLMLPPQVAPSLASSSLPSVPVLKNGSSSNNSKRSSTSKKGAGAAAAAAGGGTSKRRASSNAKAVDQETRDMMRKVSHSAIERRRRERINDKILQLKHLVPSCVDEDHLHKLSILQSTIEYIQHLKAALPDTVVNMKLKKATNNNPNNKTTDMLEAMGGMLSTKTTQQHQQLTPMLTTGLGPQQQRQHSTSSSSTSSYPLYASPTPLAARTAGRGSGINGSNSNSNTSEAMNEDESEPYPSSSSRPDMGHRYSTCSNASMMSSSSSCHSSDEDAKDGLLLLSGASESHHQVGSSSSHSSPDRRRQNRRKKRGEVDGDDEDDEDYV